VAGFILLALIIATVVVLLSGIALMGIGGKLNQRYSNRLMVARVTLQGLVIMMIALLFAGDR
jgi:hypothetical protein